jgi:D-alanyl-D-alanine carboxypeptidase (penicillin-binding protein 5/6)
MYRRRRLVVFGGGSLVLALAFFLPITLLAPLPETTATVAAPEAPALSSPVISFPAYGASGIGAVGYDGVLASAGLTTALPIASITKVVTALVVLEARPLAAGEPGPTITFGPADEQFYDDMVAQDGIVAPVSTGVTISQRALLDVTLMASANNYAQSLAAWAFGSEAAYVEAARAWLSREGFTSTTIVDATGINPANTSTITDLVELGKRAVAHPIVSAIVATGAVEVAGIGSFTNRNLLLGVNGVDGIKTGTLDESGACLLFSQDIVVEGETITIVGAVLGGPDHPSLAATVNALLTQADSGFQRVELIAAGTPLATYTTVWGDEVTAVAMRSASIVTWTGATIDTELTTQPVRLGDTGDDVGDLTFTVADRVVVVDVELASPIEDPGPWWRLANPFRLS